MTMTLAKLFVATSLLLLFEIPASADEPAFPLRAKKILFLGDSITHAGHYISLLEAQVRLAGNDKTPELINLGLPSETCSGLSEPEHPFPRPNVHERIDRALAKLKPDVVVACYGMNDGIYYPPNEERFAAYRAGIDKIIEKVHTSGAKLILMTPPAFDPLPLKKQGKLRPPGANEYSWKTIYEDYDDVIRGYAAWVMKQSDRVEMVIDLHTPVTDYVAEKRKADPEFTMSPDGVHVNNEGHEVLADTIARAWGLTEPVSPDTGLMTLISRRQKLMHDAWLSHVGHKRPGVKEGLPIDKAKAEAAEFDKQIRARSLRQQDARRGAHDDIHSIHIPGSNQPGELSLFVDYYLWIPPGVEKLRGVVVHQHGCGAGASSAGLTAANDVHWRALARKWDCALMGSSYEGRAGDGCRLWCDPRNGSAKRFVGALGQFASNTGHDELRQVPWCLWGHSGGGFWSSIMQTMHPNQIAAIWLQSGTAFQRWETGEIDKPTFTDAVFEVPVMACPGQKEKGHERFHKAWDGSHAMWAAYRAKDAPFGIAPDPRTGHECGDSRYLAIPFFDACLSQRLPEIDADDQSLRPIDRTKSWLGSPTGDVLVAAESFEGDASKMAWLPDGDFAKKWSEFLKTGAISDSTPPPTPQLTVESTSEGKVVLTWTAEADFESGLSGFRIQRDAKTAASLPDEPKGTFGRPIFQTMSYSGTPVQPLASMRWTDNPTAGKRVVYKLYSINSVGLESEPASAAIGSAR
jgi:lysophospholipase L1-like esterase